MDKTAKGGFTDKRGAKELEIKGHGRDKRRKKWERNRVEWKAEKERGKGRKRAVNRGMAEGRAYRERE